MGLQRIWVGVFKNRFGPSRKLKNEMAVGICLEALGFSMSGGTVFFFFFTDCFEIPIKTEPTDTRMYVYIYLSY